MNIEIVRELARQWRAKAEPTPQNPETYAMDRAEDQIHQSLHEKKVDEAIQTARRECAQDLEDVIRIFTEFKYKK